MTNVNGVNGLSPTSYDLSALGADPMKNSLVGGARKSQEQRVHDAEADTSDCSGPQLNVEADSEESAPIKIARDPGDPSSREREDHCVTHLPYRSWCPICVKAKGKEEAHRKRESERSIKATVSFDYKAFGQEIDYDDKATAIVLKDDKTKIIRVIVKGPLILDRG